MSFEKIDKFETLKDGGIVYELDLMGYRGVYYVPASDMQINLINYGFTAPAFVVFPEKSLSMDEAKDYAENCGLANLAREQGSGLLFMNPKSGETWENEDEGAYLAAAKSYGIAQSNFRDGLAIMEKPGCPDERSYSLLGSCVRMYVYAIGSGADYISSHALREFKGDVSLGDLGLADLTMVCCTLVKGNKIPKPEKCDIRVISVGNSDEYNKPLKENLGGFTKEETVDYKRDFLKEAGAYRRWGGKIVKAYNYESEGIIAKPGSCMVPVSDDNEFFTNKFGPFGPKEHKVGYYVFYDEKLDVKNTPVPLVLVFHGGGDSALATATIAEWPEIGQKDGFITCAVEMHLKVSAREVLSVIEHLAGIYNIDRTRIYATGFSMGGIKSWDLFKECPDTFAAVAPMDAITFPESNCFGGDVPSERINKDTLLPVFYIGGASSPLIELPVQNERALKMLQYVGGVNKLKKSFDIGDDKTKWEDPYIGTKGDKVETFSDPDFPDSVYTLHSYESTDGKVYTGFMTVTNHAHELRIFTCRKAWDFIKKYRRNADGQIEIVE